MYQLLQLRLVWSTISSLIQSAVIYTYINIEEKTGVGNNFIYIYIYIYSKPGHFTLYSFVVSYGKFDLVWKCLFNSVCSFVKGFVQVHTFVKVKNLEFRISRKALNSSKDIFHILIFFYY